MHTARHWFQALVRSIDGRVEAAIDSERRYQPSSAFMDALQAAFDAPQASPASPQASPAAPDLDDPNDPPAPSFHRVLAEDDSPPQASRSTTQATPNQASIRLQQRCPACYMLHRWGRDILRSVPLSCGVSLYLSSSPAVAMFRSRQMLIFITATSAQPVTQWIFRSRTHSTFQRKRSRPRTSDF